MGGADRRRVRPLRTPHRRVIGAERDRITAELRERYAEGATIRDLMTVTGRSYGFVRTVLLESGVVLRGRGGDHGARQAKLARVAIRAAGDAITPERVRARATS